MSEELLPTPAEYWKARAEKAEAELAKYKPKMRWVIPKEPLVRDQAVARGEPIPFGKSRAELVALGYNVTAGITDLAVYIHDDDSPSGGRFAVRVDDLNVAQQTSRLTSQMLVGIADGKEVIGNVFVVTAGWLREHKFAWLHDCMPDWATASEIDVDEAGFIEHLYFDRVPAMAPNKEAFDKENARRAAVGLEPMEGWRCPGIIRTFVRTLKTNWKEMAVEGADAMHVFMMVTEAKDHTIMVPDDDPDPETPPDTGAGGP